MLYLITNRKLVMAAAYFEVIAQAVAGGVDGIILREKDLSTDLLLPLARAIKEITRAGSTRLIINGDLEVAQAVAADGWHGSLAAFRHRRNAFAGWQGASVHNVTEAVEAARWGADYLLAGHLYPTACKADLPPKGCSLITAIKQRVAVPVLGVGGITPVNCAAVLRAGAAGIAVMSGIMAAEEPRAAVQRYQDACRHW